jgi:hypothetical protein
MDTMSAGSEARRIVCIGSSTLFYPLIARSFAFSKRNMSVLTTQTGFPTSESFHASSSDCASVSVFVLLHSLWLLQSAHVGERIVPVDLRRSSAWP